MEAEEVERRSGTRLEQHIGTILQIVIVGLLAWSLSTTVETSKKVAVLESSVQNLTVTIGQAANDRYRATDAARDLSGIRQEIQFVERRVQSLEGRK